MQVPNAIDNKTVWLFYTVTMPGRKYCIHYQFALQLEITSLFVKLVIDVFFNNKKLSNEAYVKGEISNLFFVL